MEAQHGSCVLIVADRVVVRADAGLLEAEFALFQPDCIELRTTAPGAVREAGYRTTAAEARARLAAAGVTRELADAAAEAVRASLGPQYARGTIVRRAMSELGAAEMFDGKIYLSAARAYEGRWLDLAALRFDAGDTELARSLQAMYLAALLADVTDDADVYLETLPLMQNQRPGARTLKRITFESPSRWPSVLAEIATSRAPGSAREAGATRVEVLDWLWALRQNAVSAARDRADRIERAIASMPKAAVAKSSRSGTPPESGPLSDPVAWSIEAQLDAGEADAALGRIDKMESERGSDACIAYLRARATLILKREDPEAIAERVSMLAANGSFDELELLAAQAWVAAGKLNRALPYARVLASNPEAREDLRERARALVDVAASAHPPSSTQRTVNRGQGDVAAASSRPVPRTRTLASRQEETPVGPFTPPRGREPSSPLPPVLAPTADPHGVPTLPPPASYPDDAAALAVDANSCGSHTFARGMSRPDFHAVTSNSSPPLLTLGKIEVAERFQDPQAPTSLADPRVRASYEARLKCTSMARELGMLYRTQHGIELRNDIASLEAMQSELSSRYRQTGVRTVAATLDLQRHGAFLSEVIARSMRATWLDVSASELGHWTMFVPPDTRIWPFARVLRFVTMGSKERDLVAYFLELHARSC